MRLLVPALLLVAAASGQVGTNWPSFRGPGASGVAEGYATPIQWDVGGTRNIRWKTRLPGLSHSSPVIWGNRIFLTTAVDQSKEPSLRVGLYGDITPVADDGAQTWKVLALDKRSGRILWEKTALSGTPRIQRHPKGTHANSTVATNGSRVVAMFGSEGLFCYDINGNLIWKKDLGTLDAGYFAAPDAQWGFASSPVIHGDSVIVQCDVQKGSFLASYSLADGRENWRTSRDDVPTWSTPTVHQDGQRIQVIVNGLRHIGGYDARTGKELWRLKGGGDIPVPTPIIGRGKVYLTNWHGGPSPILAVNLNATGDISLAEGKSANDGVAWSHMRGGSYMATPILYGEYLYVLRLNGVLATYVAETGNPVYEERLGDGRTGFTASPVASGGKIYLTSEDGEVYVVRAGPEFRVLEKNSLDEVTMATPAISGDTLYFRTRSHLIAIGE